MTTFSLQDKTLKLYFYKRIYKCAIPLSRLPFYAELSGLHYCVGLRTPPILHKNLKKPGFIKSCLL